MTALAKLRVLLVEDEAMVAMLIEDMLVELGATVVASAARLQDALDKAASSSFDAALLDLNLNGSLSLPVAELLLGRGLPFVFTTGYGATILPEALRRAPVLAKPFRLIDLEQALMPIAVRAAAGKT
jgi:CheY-like chemotaxis protein